MMRSPHLEGYLEQIDITVWCILNGTIDTIEKMTNPGFITFSSSAHFI